MHTIPSVFELKGMARRLRAALAESSVSVAHTAALTLLAKAYGERNWEALEARAKPAAAKSPATVPQWLEWLEADLRMQHFTELEFDELIYEVLGDRDASSINNSGLSAQLQALLDWHIGHNGAEQAQASLVFELLQDFPELFLGLPESRTGRFRRAMPMRVSICAGSRFEAEIELDALEWFAQASVADIDALVADGLHNTSRSDEVALWLEDNSIDSEARTALQTLLQRMRLTCDAEPDVVGITVDLDEATVVAFVQSQAAAGVVFSSSTLTTLAR